MDELLRHCIRELAFEGDLGCDASRLKDFVSGYHNQTESPQKVDDAYCAFVWSVVAQQPEVRVGTAPEGAPEVYIAPQFSKRDKAKSTADEYSAQNSLALIPDTARKSLDELSAEYGDALRIAVEPERSFVALTGSHIRPSSLTPPVYTCLQLIARGRENGLSSVDLSSKTGYDAKTCHYLIGKLVAMNVVVKLKKSGVGSNFCIHKYFFHRSERWKAVFAEEEVAAKDTQADEAQDDDDDDKGDGTNPGSVRFDPIDVHHLARISVVRARLGKLLKNCPNRTHKALNLLVAIGFPNPKKTERRFFQARIRELEAEGFIETIQVRRPNGKYVKCVRLVNVAAADNDEDERDGTAEEPEQAAAFHSVKATITIQRQMLDIVHTGGTEGVTLNEIAETLGNFDKRLLDFQINHLREPPPPPHLHHLGIEQTGETYGRERRYKYYTHDHYVKVAERENLDKTFPEGYFGLVGEFASADASQFYNDADEFSRFVDSYSNLAAAEASIKAKKSAKTLKEPPQDDKQSKREKKRKLDEIADGESASASVQPKKRGRLGKQSLPEVNVGEGGETQRSISVPVVPKKRGRPRKHPPTDKTATAPMKFRRPRKHLLPDTTDGDDSLHPVDSSPVDACEPSQGDVASAGSTTVTAALNSAVQPAENTPAVNSVSAPVKKRGRPRKHPIPEAVSPGSPVATASTPRNVQLPVQPEPSAPKRRGRPPKAKPPQDEGGEETPKVSKRRGRPPKNQPQRHQDVIPSKQDELKDSVEDGVEEQPTDTNENIEIGRNVSPTQSHHPEQVRIDATIPVESSTFSIEAALPSVESQPPISALVSSDQIAIDPILLQGEQSMESASTAKPSTELPAKRPLPESPSAPSTSKRLKGDWSANYRSRTNITQTRRQKEVLQVLERVGGIINSSGRELYDEHTAEVEALAEAGELTSSLPGSRIDKRTMTATLDELESQGKIRVLKSMITSSTGVARQVKIIYLPDTPQETVAEFLSGLTFAPPVQSAYIPLPSIRVVDELADYGGSRSTKVSQPPAAVILLDQGPKDHDPERAARLLRADDDTTKASLLTEPNTIVQQYGFIVGKIARIRELHMHIMNVLEKQSSSAIISTGRSIIRLSYFSDELPVSVYAAVVSCRVPNDELLQLLSTPEGRQTPLRDLSLDIQEAFEIHRARSRTRMLDNLGLLETLGLAVPLREATGGVQPLVTCEPSGEHPSSFERATCDSGATSVAPQYWMFSRAAPLFMWALDDQEPPFYRNTPVTTVAEAQQFWDALQRSSVDAEFCKKALEERPAGPVAECTSPNVSASVVKLLRRPMQWSTAYSFSWFQKQYLKKYIDVATATTPLQDEDDGAARLTRIASIVSAPRDQVVRFYEYEHDRLAKYIKRLKRRKADKTKSKEEHKAALAQKAADAKAQRERDWEEMVSRVHPEPLKGTFASRVRAVRSKFMQSSSRDMQKWEVEVKNALQEARLPIMHSRPSFPPVPLRPFPTPPPLAYNSNEKSVDDVIAQQIPLMEKKPAPKPMKGKGKEKGRGKGKGKEKEKEKAEDEKQRRARFQWNKDLDELARDAAAIIKARCRGKRLQWAALEQVFPATTANSVRQRIIHILELPGQPGYMKRLEDRWYELWMRHLGTLELPDEDPGSPTNFDLRVHLKFLRSHIDKNALRVGLVQAEQPDGLILLNSVDALHERWDVVEKPVVAPSWDFLWTGPSEEGREKQMLHNAFVMESSETPDFRQYPTEAVYVADTALKMTLATPNDVYDVERASQLLHAVDKDAYNIAARDLQEQNVVSMLVRDPKKSKPGRPLKISDQNQNALGGSIPEDLYQDACALEELAAQTEEETPWREWPLLSSDGDMAALLELVSDGKLDFQVDTSHAQSARAALDWNSKKADDDNIEAAISIRYTGAAAGQPASPPAQDVTMQESEILPPRATGAHGKTADGEIACCAASSSSSVGIVDCADCLTAATETLLGDLLPEQLHVVQMLLDALEDAGPEGLPKEELQKMVMRQVVHQLPEYVAHLTNVSPPLAFWAGNKDIVLVSSHYASAWSVIVEQDDSKCTRVLPRRWLNIWGGVMPDVWAAACRAVMGIVHFHPGIPQMELRWRLKAVYDRQAVHDVLQHLMNEGFLKRDVRTESALALEGPPSNLEEKAILWSTNNERRWYQVITQH